MTSPDPNPGPLLAKVGAFMQVAQVLGFGITFIGMSRAFQTLEPQGRTDPDALSAAVGELLYPAFIGMGIAILGIMLIILSAVAFRYRAAWFFRFLCIYGAAMIFSHMLPLGVFFVVFALLKRKEFEREP